MTNKAQSHLSEDDEMLILEWPNVRKYPEISNVLALAQHHGLPTRLLDFSYDPLVAIYFAVSNWFESRAEYHKNIEIWAYDLFHMDIGDDFNKRFKKISPKINRMDNIFAQSGVLMLDTKCNYIYNKEGRWPNFTDLSSGLKRITLPQINAREILGFLRRDSINPAMIQPNLYSTAKTVLYNMV